MESDMKKLFVSLAVIGVSLTAMAKLPTPELDDAAKAKAAEAAAKTAWSGKVEGYLLCKYQDKAVANFVKTAMSTGKTPQPATALPPCADPGPFVYVPGGAVAATAPTATPATAAAPAPAAPSTTTPSTSAKKP
jgi:hypothetical protein